MSKNARVGLWLFGIYFVLYGGFVSLNAFAPEAMKDTPVAGLNVAVLYGFALIIVAFALALLYGVFCRPAGDRREEQK